MSTYSRVVSGMLGIAAGAVLGSVAVTKLIQWWKSRHQGSAIKPDMTGRGSQGERKLKLYHSFPFRSCRCAWLVNELGVGNQVSFEHVKLHGSQAEDLMAYREVHPHGTIPCLMMEDRSVLLESSAICLYLAECFQDHAGENLLPEPENAAEYFK